MKKIAMTLLTLLVSMTTLQAADSSVKVGVVNFKMVVEQSKLGKKEQSQFESMKKQMEEVLTGKEKELNEISAKFNDPDYLDSLSSEKEAELKHKFRNLSQEMSAQQNQYYQTLNQANFKIMQKIHEQVAKSSGELAKKKGINLVVGDESTFYFDGALDVSKDIISILDEQFDKENTKS